MILAPPLLLPMLEIFLSRNCYITLPTHHDSLAHLFRFRLIVLFGHAFVSRFFFGSIVDEIEDGIAKSNNYLCMFQQIFGDALISSHQDDYQSIV